MSSNSETILSANTHPGDSTVVTVTGTDHKGDGYYGRADGLHTVQYNFAGLTGTITIQASLATTPTEDDYFDIAGSTFTADQSTTISTANFTGNFVWVRAKATSVTAGTISSILINS